MIFDSIMSYHTIYTLYQLLKIYDVYTVQTPVLYGYIKR